MKLASISDQGVLFEDDFSHTFKGKCFSQTELGQPYDAIPWDTLANLVPDNSNPAGLCSRFSKKDKQGLMFLKHNTCP